MVIMNGWILKLIGSLVEKLTILTKRQVFLVALAASLLISFTGVFDHALWTPDEPCDAEVGREMSVNGDFVVSTLAENHFWENLRFTGGPWRKCTAFLGCQTEWRAAQVLSP
jgi:hypothetical protein